MVRASAELGIITFVSMENYAAISEYAPSLVPRLTRASYRDHLDVVRSSLMVEMAFEPDIENEFSALRSANPDLVISVGMPLDRMAASRSLALARTGVDTIHLYGSDNGREVGADNPRFLKDMIREVHLILVDNSVRDRVNLVFSGGIVMAEHMAKSIICGADAVAIDVPLLVALECRLCYQCKEGHPCPVKLEEVNPDWGRQRIVNLMGAWHNQLIEVMGACGIREARRLRGEVGRSLWFEDLERESFGPLFGTRKTTAVG
jgi:glutamate synthase domain-containing protein 2